MHQERAVIEAKEVNVRDLLRNRFFEIPIYQRPFSWTEENFEEFVEDIRDAIESEEENYFLGTILLRAKEDGVTYEVVDGQQRLTSLLLLIAVFRDHLNDESLQRWLVEEGDVYAGIPSRERVVVWEDLQELFREYIFKFGGTKKFLEDFEVGRIRYPDKNFPVYHLYEAIRCFSNFVESLASPEDFLRYLFTQVYFVRIITDNRSSAFRLFNVINTRGLPLSPADVLKSMNLEAVPENERERYFGKWREVEEDLGRDRLESLISHVRTILTEEKAKKELVDEFETLFKEGIIHKGKDFFDTMFDYAHIYETKILDGDIGGVGAKERIKYGTLIDLMNRFLPFSDWIPPLLIFYKKFKDDQALYEFTLNLERKFFIEWCADFTATERITSAINLIRLIKQSNEPREVITKMFEGSEVIRRGRESRKIDFTDKNSLKNILISKLDDKRFYYLKGGKLARYLLLRLDIEMQGENFPGYANIHTITVEHILPRSPTGDWLNIFSREEIEKIINKLGNLALLNKRRNSRASNYSFERKKKSYFDVERNPFAITSMLRDFEKWDKKAFEKRHKQLLNLALKIYISETLV